MKVFICFVLLTVIYVVGMVALGRYLRKRGHGAKLEKLAGLHARVTRTKVGMQSRFANSLWRNWLKKKSGKKSV